MIVSMPVSEFKKRRDRLMSMMAPGAIALIPGASEKRRNRDIAYPFRQDSDFFYLTGFCEPDSLLVLVPGRAQGQEILFCRDRDAVGELYDGEAKGHGVAKMKGMTYEGMFSNDKPEGICK